ncbi:hypothetical protein M0812_11333 [Anaeramoeba flamelloides]|uniref:Uncharacterized protein n=1 Tax=Anaeramoeba flamelloides TaxID=1746091 RepID=A0AAV7ZYP9_9EUKA|nr:hypothetical protein M0812_11333 [Anaeramoeba flamelloides]
MEFNFQPQNPILSVRSENTMVHLHKKIKKILTTNCQEEKRCSILERILPSLIFAKNNFSNLKLYEEFCYDLINLWKFLLRGIKKTYHHQQELYSQCLLSIMKREELDFSTQKSLCENKTKGKEEEKENEKTQKREEKKKQKAKEKRFYKTKEGKKFLNCHQQIILQTQNWIEKEMKDDYFLHPDNQVIRRFCAQVLAMSSFRILDVRREVKKAISGSKLHLKVLERNPRIRTVLSWVNKYANDQIRELNGSFENKEKKRIFYKQVLDKLQQPYLFSSKLLKEYKDLINTDFKNNVNNNNDNQIQKKSKSFQQKIKLKKLFFSFHNKDQKKPKVHSFSKTENEKEFNMHRHSLNFQLIHQRMKRTEYPELSLLNQPLFLLDFLISIENLILPMVPSREKKYLFQIPLYVNSLKSFVLAIAHFIKNKNSEIDNYAHFLQIIIQKELYTNLFIRTMLFMTDLHDLESVEQTLVYIEYLFFQIKISKSTSTTGSKPTSTSTTRSTARSTTKTRTRPTPTSQSNSKKKKKPLPTCGENNCCLPKYLEFDLIEYTLQKLLFSEHHIHILLALSFLHNTLFTLPQKLYEKILYQWLFGKLFVKLFLSPFPIVRRYFCEFIIFQFFCFNPQTKTGKTKNLIHLKILHTYIKQCEKFSNLKFHEFESIIKFATFQKQKKNKNNIMKNKILFEKQSNKFELTNSLYQKNFQYHKNCINYFKLKNENRAYIKYTFNQLSQALDKFKIFYENIQSQNIDQQQKIKFSELVANGYF